MSQHPLSCSHPARILRVHKASCPVNPYSWNLSATTGLWLTNLSSVECSCDGHACNKEAGRKSIKKWYAKVGEFDNKAFNDIAAAMYDREDEILNYFVNRSTNASAESLNAKIKDFRAQLRGVIDKKFFIFRLVKIFG